VLTEEEKREAEHWWEALDHGPRILVECDHRSQQSLWTPDTAETVWEQLKELDPLFVVTAAHEPEEVSRFAKLGARAVYCDLPWRLNAELYNRCEAFLGVSSGISALSGSTACREDVLSVEFVRGEHWSTAGLARHKRRHYCYSERRFVEGLRSLRFELTGEDAEADFTSRMQGFGQTASGKERVGCPGCGARATQPFRGEDIVRCTSCNLVYLRDRPDGTSTEAYHRQVYAVGEPTAAPSIRVPENLEALGKDPNFLAARQAPLLAAAIDHLQGKANRIVDVGCGWGALLLGARERGLDGVGIELTEPNVGFARTTLGLDVRLQTFPDAMLAERSVDVVTFAHSLEHVPDPLTYLEKAAHVLREGGVLAVVVPNILSLGSTALGEAWPWLERDWHYTHFDPATLRALAIQAGFEILSCQTSSGELGEAFSLGILQKISLGLTEAQLRAQLALLDQQGHGEELCLIARRSGSFKGRLRPAPSERKILWVRTDSIGDALLSMAMLPRIADHYPKARITVVCQMVAAPLYETCPVVSDVIAYDRTRALTDSVYLQQIIQQIAVVEAELCFHSVHSREALGDLWVKASGARERVGFGGDLCNMSADEHERLDGIYTRLLPPLEPHALELDRHQAFLDALEIPSERLAPLVWLEEADRTRAREVMAAHDLDPAQTLALFPGAQYAPRRYAHYGEALSKLVSEKGLRVVALGSAGERDLCQTQLKAIPGSHVNLAGELTLRESIACLGLVKMAVGAESGLAQACVAMGTPHAVVIGGGHFGRFLPYRPLTTLAANPIVCYLCNWECPYPRPHCITDVPPQVLAAAAEAAFLGPSDRPRLFVPAPSITEGGPPRLDLQPALDSNLVELVSVAVPSPLVEIPKEAQLTVFCGVWHRDPDRHELLRGHEACLMAQTIPVRRLYVFDGGDLPPAWLDSDFVVSSRPLGLYEAWNLAVQEVRTPYLMNLNLDDRLCRDAAERYVAALDSGVDLVGGDWCICFSQSTTDSVGLSLPSSAKPFFPDWPPLAGRETRLGSGTGERGTYGPATAWRASLHQKLPHYPWRFNDGSLVRIIGDAIWWELVAKLGGRLERLPWIVGHYHSHPDGQAEFRNPAEGEHAKLAAVGIQLL
jgi:ADP-heptose:LPS heptosyltransferase/2-polyprenyl-3-methyl-5-hydroxy-6-metoxy-1,4-benzoquinol methylase